MGVPQTDEEKAQNRAFQFPMDVFLAVVAMFVREISPHTTFLLLEEVRTWFRFLYPTDRPTRFST